MAKRLKPRPNPAGRKLFIKIVRFHRKFAVVSIIVHIALSLFLSLFVFRQYAYAGIFLSSSLFFASLLIFDLVIAAKYNVFVTGGPGIAAYPALHNKQWIIANTLFYLVFIVWMMRAFLITVKFI